METHVLIAERLRYIDSAHSSNLVQNTTEIARLISGLVNSLGKRIPQ